MPAAKKKTASKPAHHRTPDADGAHVPDSRAFRVTRFFNPHDVGKTLGEQFGLESVGIVVEGDLRTASEESPATAWILAPEPSDEDIAGAIDSWEPPKTAPIEETMSPPEQTSEEN